MKPMSKKLLEFYNEIKRNVKYSSGKVQKLLDNPNDVSVS